MREDTAKMNQYVTPLDAHYENFNNKYGELLPAFIKWNSEKNDFIKLNPSENLEELKPPSYFGDNYTDQLDNNDENIIKNYFIKFEHLKKKFG